MFEDDLGLRTCQYGYCDIDELSQLAIEVWVDFKGLGDKLAESLQEARVTSFERGELLVRLRVLADTQAQVEADRMKKPPEGGTA